MTPGCTTLCAQTITGPLAGAVAGLGPILGFDGARAVTLLAEFGYGGAGTTCSGVVQTSFDGGLNWYDVARFDFTTASAKKYANLSGLTAKGPNAYVALSAEGVNDGCLGDRLQVVLDSTGTYATGTTLAIRASAR